MTNIKGRIENIEKKLNLNEKPKTVTIVQFGGESTARPDSRQYDHSLR